MISIRTFADLSRAIASPIDAYLRRLLALRREQLTDLADFAHLIVVQPGDETSAIETEAGFPLTPNDHWFEWALEHPGGWIEAVATVGDDFTVALFVPDAPGVSPELLALVRAIA